MSAAIVRGAPSCARSTKRAVAWSVKASPGVHAGIVTRTTSVRSSPARTSPSASSPALELPARVAAGGLEHVRRRGRALERDDDVAEGGGSRGGDEVADHEGARFEIALRGGARRDDAQRDHLAAEALDGLGAGGLTGVAQHEDAPQRAPRRRREGRRHRARARGGRVGRRCEAMLDCREHERPVRRRHRRHDDARPRRVDDDDAIAPAELPEGRLAQRAHVGPAAVDDDRHVLAPARRVRPGGRHHVDAHEHLAAPRRDARVAGPHDDRERRARGRARRRRRRRRRDHRRGARLREAPARRQDEADGRPPRLVRIAHDDAVRHVHAIVELEPVGRHDRRAVRPLLGEHQRPVAREERPLAGARQDQREARDRAAHTEA